MTGLPMDAILRDAERGAKVLTANRRLSGVLMRAFDQRQSGSGRSTWSRPDILPLQSWLKQQAERLRPELTILQSFQSQQVWEGFIEEDLQITGRSLLQVPATAKRAREAYRFLAQYRTIFSAEDAGEDQRAFLRWQTMWQEAVRERHWCDSADLAGIVAQEIALHGGVPDKIIFAGFDEFPPDLQWLRSALGKAGCQVQDWIFTVGENISPRVLACDSPAEEVRTCARWIKKQLLCNDQGEIGIVVPQLEAYQPLIESIFREELDPLGLLHGSDDPSAFNLSLGAGLDREGAVQAALQLLKLGMTSPLEELSWLLRSPYFTGGGREVSARCLFDRELRGRQQHQLGMAQVLRDAGNRRELAQLHQAFGRLRDKARPHGRALPGVWADHFADLLGAVGWPGDRGLSSREYQAVEHFKTVLGQLAAHDLVSGPMSRGDALTRLGRLTREAVFQPEGVASRIQVLGALEAGGLSFDQLWLLGLHDGALPQPASPNPFIPFALQRRLGLPHADAERELEFAERLKERLFHAAPEVLISWPRRDEGVERRPSPLLAGLETATPDLTGISAPLTCIWQVRPQLEETEDRTAPPLPPGGAVSGGTGILKDQALCPFRAFAHHRLKAVRLDTPDLGLDPLGRGSLVHKVLELFWVKVKSRRKLMELTDELLSTTLQEVAEEALLSYQRQIRATLPEAQRRLESGRLQRLAGKWLDLERERPSFEVLELEKQQQVRIGPLLIRTRVDRVDRLDNGQRVIIDYKTGRPDPRQWVDQRITEPQLPIYCLDLPQEEVGGVLFAAVRARAGESGFRGLLRDAEGWPGPLESSIGRLLEGQGWSSFDDILRHWQAALPALAEAFASGRAEVDPIDPTKACGTCDLVTLCRIGELPVGVSGEELT